MSREHRRSLFAFALVALACAVIMATGLRGNAIQGVRHQVSHVVAGSVVVHRSMGPRVDAAVAPGAVVRRSAAPADRTPAGPATSPQADRVAVTHAPAVVHHAPGLRLGQLKAKVKDHVRGPGRLAKAKWHGLGHGWGHIRLHDADGRAVGHVRP